MNDNNITRTHIAMEAMKVILQATTVNKTPWWKRILRLFGMGYTTISFGDGETIAKLAYKYADAMIAERDKVFNENED